MIFVWTGKTGSGKSLEMTRMAYKEWKHGAVIYSNYKLYFDHERVIYYSDLTDLLDASDAVILMDEAQVLVDSHMWASLPQEFVWKLTQHRKHRLDLFASVQNVSRIDKTLRDLIQQLVVCRKLITIKNFFNSRGLLSDRADTLFHWYRARYVDLTTFSSKNPDQDRLEFDYSSFRLLTPWSKLLYDTYSEIKVQPYKMLCSLSLKEQTELIIDIVPRTMEIPKQRFPKI